MTFTINPFIVGYIAGVLSSWLALFILAAIVYRKKGKKRIGVRIVVITVPLNQMTIEESVHFLMLQVESYTIPN